MTWGVNRPGFPLPIVEDASLHPQVVEIRDPDSQEVLGGFVVNDDGSALTVEPPALATLRAYPQAIVSTAPPVPWRVATPTYGEVVDALGYDPLGLDGRMWLDPVTGTVKIDTGGDAWLEVAPGR